MSGSPRRSYRDSSPRSLSDAEHKSQDPSPRHIDDRFHTPRAQASSARGASDNEFASPRMSARSGGGGSSARGGGGSSARFAHSDNEFGTPRNPSSARSGYNSARGESKYDDGDESDRYLEGLSEAKHTPYVHNRSQQFQEPSSHHYPQASPSYDYSNQQQQLHAHAPSHPAPNQTPVYYDDPDPYARHNNGQIQYTYPNQHSQQHQQYYAGQQQPQQHQYPQQGSTYDNNAYYNQSSYAASPQQGHGEYYQHEQHQQYAQPHQPAQSHQQYAQPHQQYAQPHHQHHPQAAAAPQSQHQQYSQYGGHQAQQSYYAESKEEQAYQASSSSYHQNYDNAKPSGGSQYQVDDKDVEDIFSYARHNRVEDVEGLLDQGVPVNVRDQYGNTILGISCQNGHKRIMKCALRRGADIDSCNYKGNSPLHFCFKYGFGSTLGAYLISKGADVTIRNTDGKTFSEQD